MKLLTQFGVNPVPASIQMAAPSATAARTLLLSPSTALAQPRGWQAVSSMPHLSARYDEVHCVGGGSLLLFLLFQAGKAPRLLPHGRVYFHGPLVLPTAESCGKWVDSVNGEAFADEYEWRSAAVSLGLGGQLHKPANRWLTPLANSIVAGRSHELAASFMDLQKRSEEKGRLVHLEGVDGDGSPTSEDALLQELCKQTCDEQTAARPHSISMSQETDHEHLLLRCCETECHDETDTCKLLLE